MIGALRGTIEAQSDQSILLMTGGVGYQVALPHAGLLAVGDTVQVFTYLAVRETALDLYGFLSQSDKDLFELLLGVPKIGPKSALQVMTQADSALLADCIQSEDPSRLHKLSGIGKKTCENIVTNLKDKVEILPGADVTSATSSVTQTQADAIDALISLGYEPKTAREHILSQAESGKELSVSELVAAALK